MANQEEQDILKFLREHKTSNVTPPKTTSPKYIVEEEKPSFFDNLKSDVKDIYQYRGGIKGIAKDVFLNPLSGPIDSFVNSSAKQIGQNFSTLGTTLKSDVDKAVERKREEKKTLAFAKTPVDRTISFAGLLGATGNKEAFVSGIGIGGKAVSGSIGAVISPFLTPFIQNKNGDLTTVGKQLNKLSPFFEGVTNKLDELTQTYFEMNGEFISKESTRLAAEGTVDIVTDIATVGAGNLIGKGIKVGTNTARKIIKKTTELPIFENKAMAIEDAITLGEKTIEDFNKQQSEIFIQDYSQGEGLKTDLIKLNEKINSGEATYTDVDKLVSNYGIKTGNEYKALIDGRETSKKYVNQASITADAASYMPTKKLDEIGNALKNSGYKLDMPTAKKKEIIDKLSDTYTRSDLIKATNLLKNRDPILIMNDLLSTEGIIDSPDFSRVVEGIETGILRDDGKTIKLTSEGIKILKQQAPDIPATQLDEWAKNGIIKYDKELLSEAKQKAAGNLIPYDEGKRIYSEIQGSRELRNIQRDFNDKLDGKGNVALDADIISELHALNDKWKLNLKDDIDNLYNSVTGDINVKGVQDFIDTFKKIETDSFLPANLIKKTNTVKNIKSALGLQEKIYNHIFKAGEKAQTIKANIEIKAIKTKFNERISKLKTKYKDRADILAIEKNIEIKKLHEKILEIRRKYNDAAGIKSDVLKNLKTLVNNGILIGNFKKVISQVAAKKSWNEAVTGSQIKKEIDRLNELIAQAYAKGLVAAIDKKLSKIVSPAITSTKEVRKAYDVTIRNQLIQLKQILSLDGSKKLSIEELEQLLVDVTQATSEARKKAIARDFNVNQEVNRNITTQLEQGVNELTGIKDINKARDGFFKKSLLYTKGIIVRSEFTSFWIKKIFGEKGVGVNIAFEKPRDAFNKIEAWIEKNTFALSRNLGNLLGDKVEDFTTMMFSFQRDMNMSIPFEGLFRMKHSPTYREMFEIHPTGKKIAFEDVENVVPFTREVWDEMSDSKLAHLINDNAHTPEFKLARKLVNSYNGLVHKVAQKTSLEVDGVDFPDKPDYMSIFRTKSKSNKVDLDYSSDTKFLERKPNEGFMKNRSLNGIKEDAVEYEPNIMNILVSQGPKPIHYAFMKPVFNEVKSFYRGTIVKLENLNSENGAKYLNKYKIVDEEGNVIDHTSVDFNNGTLLTDTGPRTFDGLGFKTSDGIERNIGADGRRLFDSHLKTIAQGGSMPQDGINRTVAKIISMATVSKLLFNIGTPIKQLGTLIDAWRVIGGSEIASSMWDVFTFKPVVKNLNEVDAIKTRIAGNPLFEEALKYSPNNKTRRIYQQWVKAGTLALRITDGAAYKATFLAAYKQALKEKGVDFTGDFTDMEAISKAVTLTDEISGTANKIAIPDAAKNVIGKAFIALRGTQMSRVNKFISENKLFIKNKEYAKMLRSATLFAVANSVEAYITYLVGKTMYELGLNDYAGNEQDLLDRMMSIQTLYNITVGQLTAGSVLSSTSQGFSSSIGAGIIKDLEAIPKALYKADIQKAAEIVGKNTIGPTVTAIVRKIGEEF